MRKTALLSAISIALLVPFAGLASDGPAYLLKYEGGSLNLEHGKATATLNNEQILIKSGHQEIAVPAKSITALAYGNAVRRRFGATVLDVVPFMRLGEAENHYVAVSWDGDGSKSEAVFRLSNSEYRGFLAELERLTGRKAVDTNQTPTVVRYGL